MATQEVQQESFWFRLSSLPIVMSAIDQAANIYECTKASNDILKYSLETAEAGAHTVVDTAKPMVQKVDIPSVDRIKSVAYEQMDKLQQSYPIIAQSPGQLYQQTKQLYDDKVKPTVDQVTNVPDKVSLMKSYTNDSIQGIKDYTTSTIDSAKYYTTEVVGGVKEISQESVQNAKRCSSVAIQGVTDYTSCNIKNVKNSTIGTIDSITDFTAKTTQEVKDVTKGTVATESSMDYYLPVFIEENESDLVSKEESETVTRLANLSLQARNKLYAHAMLQLQQAQLQSKEALGNLQHTAISFKDLPERLLELTKERLGHVQDTFSLVRHHVISSWGVSWLIR